MIIGIIKTMHTFVPSQLRRNSNAQAKRTENYIYAFDTTIGKDNVDLKEACNVLVEALTKALNITTIKDIEVSLNVTSGLYSLRFTTPTFLECNEYAFNVVWQLEQLSTGKQYETNTFKAITNDFRIMSTEVEELPVDELEKEQ